MAKKNRRPIAVFQFSKFAKIHDFIAKIRAIILSMTNAPLIFVTPNPTLASVTTDVNALDVAQTEAETRVVGATGQRDIKYVTVVQDVHDVVAYVQKVADEAGNVVTAEAIINASGLAVKINGVFQKPPLEARRGLLSGTVDLVAKAGKQRETHEWQMSTNNGASWTNLTSTLRCRTLVTGLTRLTTVYFRHRLITKTGPGDWSQPVNIVVL